MKNIVWRESTFNHHVGELDGVHVVSVVRPQTYREDGTKLDWQIEVLGSRSMYSETFKTIYDPRNLEMMKRTAETRVKWAIECLYKAAFT